MTPRVMREGGAGLLIRYTTAASPLGRMLVAATDVGVCSIAFGNDDKRVGGGAAGAVQQGATGSGEG